MLDWNCNYHDVRGAVFGSASLASKNQKNMCFQGQWIIFHLIAIELYLVGRHVDIARVGLSIALLANPFGHLLVPDFVARIASLRYQVSRRSDKLRVCRSSAQKYQGSSIQKHFVWQENGRWDHGRRPTSLTFIIYFQECGSKGIGFCGAISCTVPDGDDNTVPNKACTYRIR